MTREQSLLSVAAALMVVGFAACGDTAESASSGTSAGSTSGGVTSGGGGASSTAGGGGVGGGVGVGGTSVGAGGAPACDDVKASVQAYKAAHPGNGGKDWDINAKTPAEIAADPAAQDLLALCGKDQRPVIPVLAWEYGGSDHSWINPDASALFYCVYIPVDPSSRNWQYDAAADHVTADVYIGCPDQNPCKDEQGKDQVLACLGDPTNIEILVDTASLNDGADAGLSLSRATTDLKLILGDGTKVELYIGL